MHKPDCILEKKMHKIRWVFEVQTVHLISDKRWDLRLINKKKYYFLDFEVPVDYWVKIKENEEINKYFNLAWVL